MLLRKVIDSRRYEDEMILKHNNKLEIKFNSLKFKLLNLKEYIE